MTARLAVVVAHVCLLAYAASAPNPFADYKHRRFVEAERGFHQILKQNPKDSAARLFLARTLIELHRTPEALAELQRVLKDATNPEVRFQAGRIFRELAEKRYAQLEAAAPDSAATRELAGVQSEWAGRLDEALRHYRSAAALQSERPGIRYRIGNVLWRKREVDAAAVELRKELSITPHHGMANLRMGQVLLAADDSGGAVPFLQRAIAAMPESTEAHRELGKAYRKAGHAAEARAQWELVAKLRPEDDQIHYLLASLYREMGEASLAAREMETHRAILARRRERDPL